MKLKWSSKQPKTEGWYWWWANGKDAGRAFELTIIYIKEKVSHGRLVLCVFPHFEATSLVGGALDEISNKDDMWVGPLRGWIY